jgi:hypothetical protein
MNIYMALRGDGKPFSLNVVNGNFAFSGLHDLRESDKLAGNKVGLIE